jgi:hypothetical protein
MDISFRLKLLHKKQKVQNELPKVLSTLYSIYGITTKDTNPENFIEKSTLFYNEMNPQGFNLFKYYLLALHL